MILNEAKQRLESFLYNEVKDMNLVEREKYLSHVTSKIEKMLKERPISEDGYYEYLGADSSHDSRGFGINQENSK
ncbi:hypothetical protein LCGC14_2166410 [marine sediment metagenome]|uniref:Uncharacterized protein n=1 Tax=marine sediment metagenome TaxID=412755 RepID=A0A0F9GMG9_9ZZZZ